MARFISLAAFLALQACTAFEHSKVQHPSVKAPPVRLQWSSATPAARYPLFTGGYEHVGHLVYYNDAPNDLYPETYTFGEGTPDWMYRVPPFRMLDPGDHMMDRYIKHAKTWAEAAKAGAADVE